MRPRVQRGERGATTLMALPVVAMLVLCAVLASFIGGALVAQRRAQAAADLAALAGAGSQLGGDPCSAAQAIAQRNKAESTYCEPRGDDVVVRVEVETAPLFGRSLSVTARARAGPGA